MEVTSNHLDVLGIGHAPESVGGDAGEEISKRSDKFGAPVSQSECLSLPEVWFLILQCSYTWRKSYYDCKNKTWAGDQSQVDCKKGV